MAWLVSCEAGVQRGWCPARLVTSMAGVQHGWCPARLVTSEAGDQRGWCPTWLVSSVVDTRAYIADFDASICLLLPSYVPHLSLCDVRCLFNQVVNKRM